MYTFKKEKTEFGTIKKYRMCKSFSVAMLAVIIAYFLIVGLSIVAPSIADESNPVYFCLRFFIVSAAVFVGVLFTSIKEGLQPADYTSFKFPPVFIAVILLVFAGTFFGLSGLNDYFVAFLKKFGYVPDITVLPEKSFLSVTLCVIFIAVIPAFCEEILFRGLLLKGAEGFGKIQAVMVSALMFSLYHMSPSQTIYQFVIGVIYGFIALSSGSVIPTMILHFLNNFAIIMLNYFVSWFDITGIYEVIAVIIGVIAVAAGLFLTVHGRLKKEEKPKVSRVDIAEYLIAIVPGFVICVVMWIANLIA